MIRENLITVWELLNIQEVNLLRSPHWDYKVFIVKSFGVFLWQTTTCPKVAPKTGKSSHDSSAELGAREYQGPGWEQDNRRVFIREGERKKQAFKRKKSSLENHLKKNQEYKQTRLTNLRWFLRTFLLWWFRRTGYFICLTKPGFTVFIFMLAKFYSLLWRSLQI